MKFLSLIFFLCFNSYANTCSNFSGKWLIQGGNIENLDDVLEIFQIDCNSIKFDWMDFSLNGQENRQPAYPNYPYLFAGKIINENTFDLYEKYDFSTKNCSPFQHWIIKKLNNEQLVQTEQYFNCDGSLSYEVESNYSKLSL